MQLLLNHLRKNQVLLLIWLILFGFVTQNIATMLGVPYLFLDPEYLHSTDYRGFLIIGVALGIFITAFHITTYILDSYRFSFLGTVAHPFANFCLNNSIIPVLFVVIYIINIIRFQYKNGLQSNWEIAIEVGSLLLGIGITLLSLYFYFRLTNKDIFKVVAKNLDSSLRKRPMSRVNVLKKIKGNKRNKHQVNYYLDLPLRVKRVEEYNAYDKSMLIKIFDQNHLNAVIVEIFTIVVIVVLGLFRDISVFQIPAAASGILFFSFFVMFTGAFSYWLRGWAVTTIFIALFVFNFLYKQDWLNSTYHVFGINYNSTPADYSLQTLHALSNAQTYHEDKNKTLAILENWKKKFGNDSVKPKMIFICTSGGGQRSAAWTTRTLQYVDSATRNNLFKNTMLMSGASGGLVGAAYYRELALQRALGNSKNLHERTVYNNITRDVLNPVIYSLVVNDMFFRFQSFSDGKYEYPKDRGYAFEQQIIQNTEGLLDKRISDYREPEWNAQIPMLMISPTVINDGRKLFISPHDVAYMTLPEPGGTGRKNQVIKGIEFRKFYANQDAENLRFMSALRMSATFPYVTPNVDLPSRPVMEIMDAGLSDNYGVRDAINFLHVFKDWVAENTGGIIFMIIRDSEKERPIRKINETSIFQKMITPIGSLYANWDYLQDMYNDNLVESASSWFKGEMDVVEFQYVPQYDAYAKEISSGTLPEQDSYMPRRAALSWHLTQREKENIYKTIYETNNQVALKRLLKLLGN